MMRRAALIVNPQAGNAGKFIANRPSLLRILAERGWEAEVLETTATVQSARVIAKAAAVRCELVIACGGDGTIHDVLQGIANTPVSLGVLPFGTANALARNLELPLDPVAALTKLMSFRPHDIPLGIAETAGGARWFAVMAGAGPDGRLVHEMNPSTKARVGRGAYYAEAARLFLTRRFPPFRVEYRLSGSQRWQAREAVVMMASRVPDLGGLFKGLTAGSRLHHPHLSAPAHLSLPAWLALGRMGTQVKNPWLSTLEADEVRCSPLDGGGDTFAQVDGEGVGQLPLSLRIAPKALRLLMPDGLTGK